MVRLELMSYARRKGIKTGGRETGGLETGEKKASRKGAKHATVKTI